jgi:hypothetical protein
MSSPTPPMKNNELLFAAGDVVVWVGEPNTAAPAGLEDVPDIIGGDYACLGWVDTSGYIFKLDETTKDVPAAGTLTAIRTILTGGTKSVQATFLEALNPYVRSLYDNVPIFPTASSPLKPIVTAPPEPFEGEPFAPSAYVAAYIIPDPPLDNRYAMIFDAVDGAKLSRLYAPFTKVTARGNDQVQQADVTMVDMTFTFYPGIIKAGTETAVSGVGKRYIDYATPRIMDYF